MATLVPRTLAVRRRFEPLNMSSEWMQYAYEATVWTFNGTVARASLVPPQPDYVPGLLMCYIGDQKVDLGIFVTELRAIGLTLRDVEQAINAPPSTNASDPHAQPSGTPTPRDPDPAFN